jgi:hypothetical protein
MPGDIGARDVQVETAILASIHPIGGLIGAMVAAAASRAIGALDEELEPVLRVERMKRIAGKHGARDMEIELAPGAMVDECGGFEPTCIAPARARCIGLPLGNEPQHMLVLGMLNKAGGSGTARVGIEVALGAAISCCWICRFSAHIAHSSPTVFSPITCLHLQHMAVVREV